MLGAQKSVCPMSDSDEVFPTASAFGGLKWTQRMTRAMDVLPVFVFSCPLRKGKEWKVGQDDRWACKRKEHLPCWAQVADGRHLTGTASFEFAKAAMFSSGTDETRTRPAHELLTLANESDKRNQVMNSPPFQTSCPPKSLTILCFEGVIGHVCTNLLRCCFTLLQAPKQHPFPLLEPPRR